MCGQSTFFFSSSTKMNFTQEQHDELTIIAFEFFKICGMSVAGIREFQHKGFWFDIFGEDSNDGVHTHVAIYKQKLANNTFKHFLQGFYFHPSGEFIGPHFMN